MNEYITYEFLGTFAGMVVVLNLLVQFFKPLIDKLKKIHTQYVVWVIAVLLTFAVQAATGTFTADIILRLILNSVLLALTAMGSYEKLIKPLKK